MDKMAFLNKVRSLPLPPVKNILNVAVQTARQTIPEKNKGEYEQPNGPQGQGPPVPPRPQNVRFADQQPDQQRRVEHHELNPFGQPNSTNPFGQAGAESFGQETSFMGDYESGGYQQSENYLNR